MLILSLKEGEALKIGERTYVIIRRIRGRRITMLVSAPEDVPIERRTVDDEPARRD